MTFFQDQKSPEELYDLASDPDELRNLAADPSYATVLAEMRAHEQDWSSKNDDHGLKDLGSRKPDLKIKSVLTVNWIQENHPDLWDRLAAGELMKTQAWSKLLPKKQKAEPAKE